MQMSFSWYNPPGTKSYSSGTTLGGYSETKPQNANNGQCNSPTDRSWNPARIRFLALTGGRKACRTGAAADARLATLKFMARRLGSDPEVRSDGLGNRPSGSDHERNGSQGVGVSQAGMRRHQVRQKRLTRFRFRRVCSPLKVWPSNRVVFPKRAGTGRIDPANAERRQIRYNFPSTTSFRCLSYSVHHHPPIDICGLPSK